jgi:hypothetical protein
MPEILGQYQLLSSGELQACSGAPGAQFVGIYLSKIALVAWLEFGGESISDLRDRLPTAMRVLQDCLRRYGADYPLVVVLHPGQSQPTGTLELKRLEADQDWHRGEFSLFIEKSRGDAEVTITGILEQSPPGQEIAASAPRLDQVAKRAESTAEEGSLLWKLAKAWGDENTQGTGQAGGDPGVTTIREYAGRLVNSVSVLLSEL